MMTPTLRAYLFGCIEFYQNSQAIALPSSTTARSLLAYLCLHRQHPLPRAVLAGIFWPEETESRARRALSQALWQIRNSMPDLVTADPHSVHIPATTPLWVDVAAFKELTTPYLTRHAKIDEPSKLEDLHRAVQIYRNDLLEGIYDEWVFIERESLRAQYLRTLEILITAEKSFGHYADALEHGNRLMQVDPLRESTYRELMQISLALGQPETALGYFETCQQVLQTELGVKPETETIALAKEISRKTETGELPYLPPQMTGSAPLLDDEPRQLPLIGREQERLELVGCIEGIFENRGGVTLVEGDAGVGKTRLLQETIRDAQWRGAQTLWGGCQEIEAVAPYDALIKALRNGLSPLRAKQLTQILDDIWVQVLSALIPELAFQHQGDVHLSELAPDQAQERLNSAFTQLFIAWAQITPLVLVIEDIHWASADLINILITIAKQLREQRVLILITYRSEEARANPNLWTQIQSLDRAGSGDRLLLTGLDAKGSGQLVQRALRLANPAPLFEERLHRDTRGNPLFLLETLRSLLEEKVLTQDENGNWHTPWDEATTDYDELPTPAAVENVIARRLKNIAPQLEGVLSLCTILGEYFDFSILQAASELELSQLLILLGELVHRRFLMETAEQYAFSHARVREVIYDSLPEQKRRRLHRQAAETLEQHTPKQIARLAYHFYQAQLWEKNLHYSKLAGDQAADNFANNEALAHYTRAIELTPENRLDDHFALLLAREKICDLVGDREAQTQDLETLTTLTKQIGSADKQAEVALRQSRYADGTGNYPAAIAAAQEAVTFAQHADNAELESRAFVAWGKALWRQGSYEDAHIKTEQALVLAKKTDLRWLEADVLNNLGNVSLYQGDYLKAKDYFKQTLLINQELGNRQGEGNAIYNIGYVLHDLGDLSAAASHYQRALKIYREIGFGRGVGSALNVNGIVKQDMGDYPAARSNFEQSLEIAREINDRQSQALALANIGVVCMNVGDYASVRPYFEQGLQIQKVSGDQRGEGAMLASLSSYYIYQEDYEPALAYAQRALAIFDEIGDRYHQGFTYTYLGDGLAGLGQLDAAARAYQRSLDIRQEAGFVNHAAESLASLARLALTQDNLQQALVYTEQILRHLEEGTLEGCIDPMQVYLTCYRVLAAHQDPRAAEILETAHTQLQERAARIDDPAMRRSFLENVTANREVIAAYQDWQFRLHGRQIEVRLPKIEAPTGRPLREDEWVQVIWTVDKREDADISGKPARRQQRLLRLLEEAESQGGMPTLDDLADALDVSHSTIKRCLAKLRKQGHTIQTRGSRSTSF